MIIITIISPLMAFPEVSEVTTGSLKTKYVLLSRKTAFR
jgi:hypothetical protein